MIAYYDLWHNPATYDVVSFLMWAEHQRVARPDEKLTIEILPGPDQGFRMSHLWPTSYEERHKLLHKVVVPMCSMLTGVVRVTVRQDRNDIDPHAVGFGYYSVGTDGYVRAYREGIRPLSCGPNVRDRQKIVMTLREAEHWPARNSNVREWRLAARTLRGMGYKVIVVRDTAFANQPLDGCEIDIKAAQSLAARGWLYGTAALNMFVNNGPAWFCFAMDLPALVMRPITETTCHAHTREAWASFGLTVGGQYPNAPPYQQLCWQDDTHENIVAAAVSFMQQMYGDLLCKQH